MVDRASSSRARRAATGSTASPRGRVVAAAARERARAAIESAPPGRPADVRKRPGEASRSARPAAAGGRGLDRVLALVAQYFTLLGAPARLAILHAIRDREESVGAIVAATGASQSNVSRHLGLLHRAGVVSRRRDGSLAFYRVADPVFLEICRALCVHVAARIDDRAPLREDLLAFAAVQAARPRRAVPR